MLDRRRRLSDARFGRRLGFVTLVAVVCALALASSALRWGVSVSPSGYVDELKDERPADERDCTSDRGDTDVEALPQEQADQAATSAEAESSSPDERYESKETTHVTTYETSSSLESSACELLERYRDMRCCLMRHAGYIDLLGNVWSCVVEGPGWVDVCLVSALDDCASCQVSVSRLEVEEWEEHAVV